MSDDLHDRRLQEAADWQTQLEAGQADELAFEAWRADDPLNAVAFAKIHAATLSLEAQAPRPAQIRGLYPIWTRRNLVRASGAFLGAASLSALSYLFYFRYRGSAATERGGRETLTLDKAVTIELNTASKVDWQTGAASIDVILRRGEIYIRHMDGARVCNLICGASRLWLAPGEYLARKDNEVLDLLVLHGRAHLATKSGGKGAEISTAQSVVITTAGVHARPLSPEDQRFRAGWRGGTLDLNGQVLSEVVAEYNRYLEKPIRILDPSVGGLKLGGQFDLRDPKVFLDGLKHGFGLHVTEDDKTFAVSR